MKRSFRIFFIALGIFSAICAQSLRQVRPESVGMSSERLRRLSQQMDAYVSNNQLAGSVTMILRKGKIAYTHANGYRDIESNDVMEEDSDDDNELGGRGGGGGRRSPGLRSGFCVSAIIIVTLTLLGIVFVYPASSSIFIL